MLYQGSMATRDVDPNCVNQPMARASGSEAKEPGRKQPQKPKKAKAPASTSLTSASTSTLDPGLVPPMPHRGVSEPGGLCLLCCNPIVYHVIADCAHAAEICATCALRMKVFPPKKIDKATGKQEPFVWTCPFCKTFWNRVQLSASALSPLSNIYDPEVDLFFDSESTVGLFKQIRAYYCTACPPEKRQERFWFSNIRSLENHMDRNHGLYFCVACLETQSVFIQDRRTYTKSQLTDHYKYGTAARGDQAPIAPHPFCNFCTTPYYSDDELYVHLTTQHKQCKFCPPNQKFFRDNRKMYDHYATAHHVCKHPECNLNSEDVTAFRDLLDLKAHELQVHTDRKNMTRAELRALTTLSLGFNTSITGNPHPRRNNTPRDEPQDNMIEEPIIPAENFEESYPSLGSSIADRAQAANSNLHLMSNKERKETQQLIDSLAAAPPPVVAPTPSRPLPPPQWRPPPPADDFPSLPGAKVIKDDKKFKDNKKLASVAAKSGKVSTPMKSAPMIPRPEPRGETSFPSLPIILRDKKIAPKPEAAPRTELRNEPTILLPAPVKAEKKVKSKPTKAASPVETKEPAVARKPLPIPFPCPPPWSDSEAYSENQALISQVKLLVGNGSQKLKEFRDSAKSFQDGHVSAKEYYQTLLGIFVGTDATKQITLLLLRLIPDDKKRKELYAEYVRHFYDSVVSGLPVDNQERPVVLHTEANDAKRKAELEQWGTPPPYSASISSPASSLSTNSLPCSSSSSSLSSHAPMSTAERSSSTDSVGPPMRKAPILDESFGPPLPSSKKTLPQSVSSSQRLDDFGPPLSALKKPPSMIDDSFGPPLPTAKKSSAQLPPAAFQRGEMKATEEAKKPTATLAPRIDDSFGPPLSALKRSSSLPTPELADEYLSKLADLSVPANVKKDLEFLGMVLLQVSTELGDRVGDLVNATCAKSYQCSGEKKEQLKQVVNRVRLAHVANFAPVNKFGLALPTQTALMRATTMHQSGDVDSLPLWVTQTLTQMTPQDLYLLYEYLHLLLARFTDPTRSHKELQDTNQQFEDTQRKQQARNAQFDGLVPLKANSDDDIFETKSKTVGGELPGRGKDKKKKDKKFVPLYLD